MGGFGSQIAAINTLKNNRNARRSKRKGYKDNFDPQTLSSKKLKFKNVSGQELKKIKSDIQQKMRREARMRKFIFVFIILVIFLAIGGVIFF